MHRRYRRGGAGIGERALRVLAGFLDRSIGREPPYLQDPDRREPPTPLVKALRAGGAGGVPVCGSVETVRGYYVRYPTEGNADYLVINLPFGDMDRCRCGADARRVHRRGHAGRPGARDVASS